MLKLKINGKSQKVEADPDMPLLWVLRDLLGMNGTKFGCGVALCGACTVHLDGIPRRSCVMPVRAAVGHAITTIEGIGATPTGKSVQQAWLDLEVVQCGYCQSGQIMAAAALLAKIPSPTDADIDQGMSGNICRCGTYPRIREAIKRAARKATTATKDGLTMDLSRRQLLFVGAAAGGGLLVGWHRPEGPRILAKVETAMPPAFAPNAFIRIGKDGRVTLIMNQVEMGQG